MLLCLIQFSAVSERDLLYGNAPEELLIAAAIATGVLLIVWAIRAVAHRKLAQADRTETEIDDFVVEVADRTKVVLLLLPVIYVVTRAIEMPPELRRALEIAATLSFVAQAALWLSGVVDFWIHQYRRRRLETDPAAVTTINVFRIAAVSALWIIAVLFAIDNLGGNIGALIAGLGIGGIAVALATQNILGDLFASLSIVIDKPFVIGDFIIVGESLGTVEHVGLKTTQIRALSGEQLIIGNNDLLKSRIRNFKRMLERRVVFKFGVIYQTPVEKLERIPLLVRAAVEKQTAVRFDRSHLIAFGESSYDFESVYWVLSADYNQYADIHHAICLEIVRAFEAEGIAFAYPTRTLFMKSEE